MRAFLKFITKIAFKLFFRVDIVNINQVPKEGPALLCANHNTILDMFFLGYKLDRWIYWMAKEELFKNPVMAYVLKKLGAFPVKRGTGDVSSIKTAFKLLKENKIVGIFPHGTRIGQARLKTARVKPGAAMIAANSGVPVIPAAVCGNYGLFGKMKVIYGEPFLVKPRDKKLTKEELAEISREIINRVRSLAEVGS
ncbi:MAG: lysophospholipid acyltransferase family protein [Bacillota bacterium]